MKKYLRCISFTLIFISTLRIQAAIYLPPDTLRIGTATKGLNYWKLGLSIQEILKDYNINIKPIITQGSGHNIGLIDSNKVDLAIVQNDIAFFAENGLDPYNDKISHLKGITTFYLEPIFIITNDSQLKYLNQLVGRRINIGLSNSGLFADSRIILGVLDLWNSITTANIPPADVVNALLENRIQASFINNITSDIEKEIVEGRLFVIRFVENLRRSLINTYPYLSEYTKYINGVTITTLGVKSILVCNDNLDINAVNFIAIALYERFSDLYFPPSDITVKREDITKGMPLDWHKGAEDFYSKIGLVKKNKMLKYSWLILLIPTLYIIFIILMNFIFYIINKKNIQYGSMHGVFFDIIRKSYIKIVNHKYIVVLVFIITAYFSTIVMVQRFEHDWALRNNAVSIFDNRPFLHNLLWMFVFGGSGYEDNLFPQSPLGKLFVTFIPLIGVTGFVAIGYLLTSDHIKNRILEARGVKTKTTRNHIIICGWNSSVPQITKQLLHENITHKCPIIILAPIQPSIMNGKVNLEHPLISFVKGEATSKDDLDRAHFRDADMAIIVADEGADDPDAKNILKVFTIEKYCKELEKKGLRGKRKNIYTIAEIRDPDSRIIAKDADVDEILELDHFRSKIFVNSILNRGVSEFLSEILTHDEYNDIYSIKVKGTSLEEKSYNQLAMILREEGILLLSIKICADGTAEEFEKIKDEHKLKRPIITNPIDEHEIDYQTEEKDSLIVLAQKEKIIDKAVKKFKREKRRSS